MNFSKLLIDIAFLLDNSPKYKKIKGFFRNLLTNDNYPYKRYFDLFMIFLILTSVGIIIEEVTTPISRWLYYYDVYFVTTVFIIEYLLRLWVHDDIHKIVIEEFENSLFLEREFDIKKVLKEILHKKLEYIFSPLAIIDLLAIIPSYREFRILRVFVLFRVFKLLRYSHNVSDFLRVISSKKFEFYTLFVLLTFIILISGISIYVFEEHTNKNIHSLFDAFYWAMITISTVGYGDVTPLTTEGRVLTMMIIIVGVGLISFATSIIVSAFSEKMEELRANRVFNQIRKLDEYHVICGYTHITQLFIQRLKKEGIDFVVIDTDKEIVEDLLSQNILAIAEDASKREAFRYIDFDKVKSVMAMTNNDMHNIYICLNIRSFSKDVKLIARTIEINSYKKLKLAGVDEVISPYNTAGLLSAKIIEQPIAVQAINDILNAKKNALCDQVEVIKDSFLDGSTIGQIDFSKYKLLLLGVVRTNKEHPIKMDFYFNPDDEFVLTTDDVLVVIGYTISVASFKSFVIESSLKHE